MHAAVVAVARAPRISRLASVAAVSIRGGERARARATLTRAASSGPMAPIVELYARVDETLPADPASTPADESHFRAIAPYMNAVEPRHLAMEPPSTSRRSSEDSEDSAPSRPGILLAAARPRQVLFLVALPVPVEVEGVGHRLRQPTRLAPVQHVRVSVQREGTVIPLHNHPHMTVMSKLLYGSLRVRAFDWADDDDGNPGTAPNVPRLARMVRDERVAAPANAFALYPRSRGNIHVFTAAEPSAVWTSSRPVRHRVRSRLPLLRGGSVRAGRGSAPPGHAWLLEVDCPDDFEVERGEYHGPRFGSRSGR